MCGRYVLHDTESLRERFDVKNRIELRSSYNISPGRMQPVIVKNLPNRLELMRWGLVPFWVKKEKSGGLINARAEGIEEKASFRKAIRQQRCLIPANGFYEWGESVIEGKKEKHPYFFFLKENPLFTFAGIFDIHKGPSGKETKTYAIITTEANDNVKSVHNRMPVILDKLQETVWLDGKTDLKDILNILKSPTAYNLQKHIVSRAVNNPGNDNPQNIKALQKNA